MHFAVTTAVSLDMRDETFDVSAALLSGMPTLGYSGRFASSRWPFVTPGRLLQVLMGAVTMTELRCARAVLTKHDFDGKLIVISTSHVDDGLLLSKRHDPIYQKGKKHVSEQFDAKISLSSSTLNHGKICTRKKKLIIWDRLGDRRRSNKYA